jgi:hypothetical protein
VNSFLLFWLTVGASYARRYDRAGRDRLDPDLLAARKRFGTVRNIGPFRGR